MEDTTTGAQAGIAVDGGSLLVDGADSLRIGNIRLTSTGLESIVSGQDISIGNRGDLGFLVPSRGIKFPDGTTQTTATLQGPTGPQGATGATGPQGPVGPMPTFAYGSFYDTTDQLPSVINTAYAMSFNQHTPGVNGVVANGVSVLDDGSGKFTKLVFAHPGTYNVAFSAQLEKSNSGVDYASIWLSQNGSNVPWTDTEVGVDGTTRLSVAAWNFFVTTTTANEFVQLMWSSGDTHLGILAQDPVTGPARPGIPSVILTVNQVK